MKRKLLLVIVVLAVLAVYRSVLLVDETELVIVTQFGRPVDVVRVAGCRWQREFPWIALECEVGRHDDAGLHFKLPYQSAIRLDRRLQIYDPKPSEFLTKEKKNVNLDVFVCWRVDREQPQRFVETVNDFASAEMRIHDIVWAELPAELGRNSLDALVSVDAELHRLDDLVGRVAARCAERARSAYGIEIVDVRLKRINLPAENRNSVFDRMRTERSRIARQYRAEGDEKAMEIRAEANLQQTVILSAAKVQAEQIRGKAEAEATGIYAEAYRENPKFYELVRSLQAYRTFLDGKTTIFLSTDSDVLKYLTRDSTPDQSSEQK